MGFVKWDVGWGVGALEGGCVLWGTCVIVCRECLEYRSRRIDRWVGESRSVHSLGAWEGHSSRTWEPARVGGCGSSNRGAVTTGGMGSTGLGATYVA